MSRKEKITKLCRAVRAYRGIAHGRTKEGNTLWSITPKPSERPRVIALMQKLGIDPEEIILVDEFKTIDELHQWVETLR